VARLGALMLTSVLLGLPCVFRAGWAVERQRSRYVEQAPCDAGLLDFIAALERLIDVHCRSLAGVGAGGATVVEVHRLMSQSAQAELPPAEAISVSVEKGGCVERLVLHAPPGHHAGAARALAQWLTHGVRS
jgi:hypothetical protein